jgi:ketosteroid isomerase-like protein
MKIEVANVFVADDVAMVFGALTLSGTNGEHAPYSQRSNSVVIYRRGPDGWRVAIDTPWGLPAF